ncbi:hypothetical protein F8M41_011581 [Gigaspora margarita]|uniref:Uncharacterized protein n=1 Tax=Gigaspora margarita TaxID=4874 RepID=A0A8H4EPQ8_GIGMA|nr:hypothetical protein F8M41_011581 [Gigaspora margarita]
MSRMDNQIINNIVNNRIEVISLNALRPPSLENIRSFLTMCDIVRTRKYRQLSGFMLFKMNVRRISKQLIEENINDDNNDIINNIVTDVLWRKISQQDKTNYALLAEHANLLLYQ